MVKNCCVVGCHNVFKKNSGIQFYRFPTNPEKRSKWIAAVKRDDWAPNDNTWICSTHFVMGKGWFPYNCGRLWCCLSRSRKQIPAVTSDE